MQTQPDGMQTLFLWRLLVFGGAAWLKEIKPEIDAKKRKSLRDAGLIEEVKEKRHAKGKLQLRIVLTDRGWNWSAENLDAKVSDRSIAAGPILQNTLSRLKSFLAHRRVALAEIFGPEASVNGTPAPAEKPVVAPEALVKKWEGKLRQAYWRLTRILNTTVVPLAEMRREAAEIPRQEFDAAMRRLEEERKLVIPSLREDPLSIRPEDRDAAIIIGGIPCHIVMFKG